MFYKKIIFLTSVVFSIFGVISLKSAERIISFDVTLEIHQDASMGVKEEIIVFAEGKNIKRGIVREIPTVYHDYFGTRATIDFSLKKVLQDGQPVHYEVKNENKGKVIEIGTDEKIPLGEHIYMINYKVNRHLGFFKDYDELYWNVTGSNWRLSMDQITAVLILPKEIPVDSVAIDGYTGKHGQKGKDFVFEKTENKIIFKTTKHLQKFEGFTISVSWPKGCIKEPPLSEKLSWFFYDNSMILLLILCFLLFFVIILYLMYVRYFYHEKGTIIPLFYPPESLTPSQVGYVYYLKFKEQFFAADIVDLAVRGFIEIDYERKWMEDSYTLIKKENATEIKSGHDQRLLELLFSSSDKIRMGAEEYRKSIIKTINFAEEYCKDSLKNFFVKNYFYEFFPIIYFIIIGISVVLLIEFYHGALTVLDSPAFIVIFVLCFVLSSFISHFSVYRTKEGQRLKDEIDGFKLFLTTTELERMNIIGTPPTKTPELYEKYLPYAIALGVEKQWTKQFASAFEKLAKSGNPYVFVWYRGKNFNVSSFGSSFPSSFTSNIRSSGAGGRGSSGGGRGGGGGGGR